MKRHEKAQMQTGPIPRRSRGRPSVKQANELTTLIVEVARRMFLEYGYDNTSIDDIAAAARISKSTLYARFKEKTQLFEAVCMQIVDNDFSKITKPDFVRGDIHRTLEGAMIALLEGMMRREIIEFERMTISVAGRFPELARVVERARGRVIVGLQQLLLKATQARELVIDDVEEASWRLVDGTVVPQFRSASLGLRINEITEDDRNFIKRYVSFYVKSYTPADQ